jgi:DNA-binding CsgD family transcriptional regulator
MQALDLADVERIVRMISTSSDPTVKIALHDRKRLLLEGTAELIDADMWMWSMAVLNPEVDRDVMSTGVVDGGWRDENERVAAIRVLTDPKFNEQILGPVVDACQREAYTTFLRSDLVPDATWEKIGKEWRETGYDANIVAVYPLKQGVYSGVGFHRRMGKPDFGDRERAIVHVIFGQVDWLHREGSNLGAGRLALQLSPRQRQVLIYLLGGDSRKEIARKLQLSEHTVGDYLKQIYKQFSVNSRSALLAHFISGGRN